VTKTLIPGRIDGPLLCGRLHRAQVPAILGIAAAIQVITQEDIRRSGATSIPEALRLADNLEVAQKNSHDWAISARGFNTALGNKLLVMIDGRTVYSPLYSGVFWDAQDYLLEDIDRIDSQASAQDRLTLQGDMYDGREDVQTGGITDTSGANLLGRWTRTLSDDSDLSLQSSIDQTHRSIPETPLIIDGLAFTPAGTVYDDLITYDVDFQHQFQLDPRDRVVWGLGFRRTEVQDQSLYSAFVQDEFTLQKGLSFTLGTKLEHNAFTSFTPATILPLYFTNVLTGWGQRLIAANDIPPHVDKLLSKPPRLHELRAALAELVK
jgi:outer membrane receptor for ferrienterochelin and colicin